MIIQAAPTGRTGSDRATLLHLSEPSLQLAGPVAIGLQAGLGVLPFTEPVHRRLFEITRDLDVVFPVTPNFLVEGREFGGSAFEFSNPFQDQLRWATAGKGTTQVTESGTGGFDPVESSQPGQRPRAGLEHRREIVQVAASAKSVGKVIGKSRQHRVGATGRSDDDPVRAGLTGEGPVQTSSEPAIGREHGHKTRREVRRFQTAHSRDRRGMEADHPHR